MSGILAIFERVGSKVDRETASMMMEASAGRGVDGSDLWSHHAVALGHHHFWITPEEQNERQPLLLDGGRLAITADVRLDNRAELAAALDLDKSWAAGQSDSMLLLLAYQRWSVDCVSHLAGDFAFAIWDEAQQQLFAARDPLGVRQLYYALTDQLLLLATEIDAILAHPAVELCVNRRRVAEYLALQMDYGKETFFADIYYCPPAHCLLVTAHSSREWRYWSLDLSARLRYKDPRDYGIHFLNLLRRAVHDRLRCIGPVAISLSGGLDSTSVAALAAAELAQLDANQTGMPSYSYVFDELHACDERAYISPIVDRYGLKPNYIVSDNKWPLRDLANWPVQADPVTFDPYWWLIIGLMQKAQQDGTRVILTGHFGDWLFEGAAYWVVDMLRDLRLRELWSTVRSGEVGNRRIHLIDYGLRQFIPPRARDIYRMARPRDQIALNPSVHPELVIETSLYEQLEQRRPPAEYGAPGTWKRYRKLTHGVVPPTMAAIMTMWNQYGIEHLEPMRDRQLVEFALSVPADQLGLPSAGSSKRLLRSAMSGILPDSVRLRRDKTSFRALYLRGLMKHERGTVERILRQPEIVRRNLVDPAWLAATLPQGCRYSDEGFSLWRCVTLELWLQRYFT